ncbi:major capsid protein [Aurantimonas sp. A2-1-M11]|uniref:major capsid protein n=1 Tax=Aurantimonas sp. A2-1-M11 TaxID=3113712 RepID=UPI002F95482B
MELTNAINKLPYRPDGLGSLFNWQITRSPTTGVRINMQDGKVEVAPYVPRRGVPPVLHGNKRSAVTVDIPGIAGRASVLNRKALNVSAGPLWR